MKKIQKKTSSYSVKKKSNTHSSVKDEKIERIRYKKAKYEKVSQQEFDKLVHSENFPKTNLPRLHKKLMEEFEGFFKHYNQSTAHIPVSKFEKMFGSFQFQQFWSTLMIQTKSDSRKRDMNKETEAEYRAMQIMLFTKMYFKGFEGLIDQLPMKLRNIVKEDMKPKMKMLEALTEYAREINPKIAKDMDLLRTNLTNDDMPVY